MAYSIKHACANKNDELYTPKILAEAIEKYLVSLYKRLERERERERERVNQSFGCRSIQKIVSLPIFVAN